MKRRNCIESIDSIEYHEVEPGFLHPGNSIPSYKLIYVNQGQMHCVADGNDLLLTQGDLVMYGPDQWHMQYAEENNAPSFVTIIFQLRLKEYNPLLNRKFTLSQELSSLLQKCMQEYERMDVYSPDIIINAVELMLLLLVQRQAGPALVLKTPYSVHSENQIVRHAQQYIANHIRDKLSVPMVAKNVDVSPSYLTALFHKHLHLSPGEYIRRVKLQECKHLIREGKLNFTEISAVMNYSTVHHFSRQFKEKFGITPTDYAKSIK